MIYFAQGDTGGPIKVGYTRSLDRRIAALQNGSHDRINILGTCPGSEYFERSLHARFQPHRISGEWFLDCPEIRGFIAGHCTAFKPTPPPAPEGHAGTKEFNREFRETFRICVRDDKRSVMKLAAAIGVTQRQLRNWRQGLNGPNGIALIKAAYEIPSLRAAILRWLEAADSGQEAAQVLDEIRRLLESRR